MRKLNEEQTMQFIALYKENSCLWDITLDDYKNKAMRQSALENILEGMKIENMTVDDVKSKIKSIRSTYCLELDKIEKSTVFGGCGNVYEPKMKWFAEFDSFIKNVMVKRKARVCIIYVNYLYLYISIINLLVAYFSQFLNHHICLCT